MEEQEINLLDLLLVIVKRKCLIIGLCLLAAAGSAAYSLSRPDIYAATAKVVSFQRDKFGPVNTIFDKTSNSADLVALSTPLRPGGMDVALGMIKSNTVKNAIVKRFDLIKVYGAKSKGEARRFLESAVKIKAEKDGYISITVEDKDPVLAAEIANAFVDELGRISVQMGLTRDQVKSEQQAGGKAVKDDSGEFYVLKLLDKAEAPTQKIKPTRSMMVLLASVTSLFIGIFLAFMLEFFQKMEGADKSRVEELKRCLGLWKGAK